MKQKVIYIETNESFHKALSVASTLEQTSVAEIGRKALKKELDKLAKKHPSLVDLVNASNTELAA